MTVRHGSPTEGSTPSSPSIPLTDEVTVYPLPDDRPDANLNTAAFDGAGLLWFTGQNGIHGVLDPATGTMEVFDSPRGRGPYGIAASPLGTVYFASLAGSYVGQVAPDGSVTVLEPPTADQGARRVWSDSMGSIWVSEWNSGRLSRYDRDSEAWDTWPLPGPAPQAYAVYVDEADVVWVSDFGGNAIHRFDPATVDLLHLRPSVQSRQRAPDPRPVRRGVGRRVRCRPTRRDPPSRRRKLVRWFWLRKPGRGVNCSRFAIRTPPA